jgi:mono/diheme cytochrome c family protein
VPDPRLLGGLASYAARGCASCHGVEGRLSGGEGAAAGAVGASMLPLAERSHTLTGAALVAHVEEKTPKPAAPVEEGGEDPNKDVPSLLEYVAAVGNGDSFASLPTPIRTGGAAIDREDCRQCHQIYGDGGRKGPALQHLLGKREKAWLVGHFKDPKKYVEGSKMPSFKYLSDEELAAMADYLLALP